jgi:hypothetical protein
MDHVVRNPVAPIFRVNITIKLSFTLFQEEVVLYITSWHTHHDKLKQQPQLTTAVSAWLSGWLLPNQTRNWDYETFCFAIKPLGKDKRNGWPNNKGFKKVKETVNKGVVFRFCRFDLNNDDGNASVRSTIF